MKIRELLKKKQECNRDAKPVTIAFIGDSVTQGCFECYLTSPDSLENVYDYACAYSTRVKEILNMLYPSVQINIINSGIAGDNALGGESRFERDVLAYNPDLAVHFLNGSYNQSVRSIITFEFCHKNICVFCGLNRICIISKSTILHQRLCTQLYSIHQENDFVCIV